MKNIATRMQMSSCATICEQFTDTVVKKDEIQSRPEENCNSSLFPKHDSDLLLLLRF